MSKADVIFSTSHIMANEINKYSNKNINVIPFGIDIDKFKPLKVNSIFNEKDIVIGTIKSLEKKYGIEYLIKAFKILVEKFPSLPLKLLIGGTGSLEIPLKNLVTDLHLVDRVIFTGLIKAEEVPIYHNMFTVFVTVSISDSESFGVSAIEASACEKPVVVSNVGGLPEVIVNEVTGIIVNQRNPSETADAIARLIVDKTFSSQLGINGRKRVIEKYNIIENVTQTLNIYNKLIPEIN